MSSWLKWRLIALFGLTLVMGGGAYLKAQENYPAPPKTPEEASEQFLKLLEVINSVEKGNIFNWPSMLQYAGSMSRVQMLSMSQNPASHKGDRLLGVLAKKAYTPQFSVHTVTQTDKQAVVSISPVTIPPAHEIICIPEDGGWRVDVFATYGKWTNLSGEALDMALYNSTGYVSSDLANNSNFMRSKCQSNLKQVMLGIKMYVQDYDERLPPAKQWTDVLQPYVKNYAIFACPSVPENNGFGYAYNARLSQKNEYQIDDMANMVNVYETPKRFKNAYGMGTDLAFRHLDGANYGYADGHVKWLKKDAPKPQFTFKP